MSEIVEIPAGERLICPNKKMPLWSSHPRVFLVADEHGIAKCSYCGTQYHQTGEKRGH